MHSDLLRRLRKLESVIHPPQPRTVRFGWRIPLPSNYVGERHVVVEDLTQVAPGVEWCNFVEHPDLRQVVTKGRWDTREAVKWCVRRKHSPEGAQAAEVEDIGLRVASWCV